MKLVEEALYLIGVIVVLTTVYLVGQAYYKPIIRVQGLQSFLIGGLSVSLYFITGRIDNLILALEVISLRGIGVTFTLERAVKGRYGYRETVRGVASLLVADLILVSAVIVVSTFFQRVVASSVMFPEDVILAIIVIFQGLALAMFRKGTIPQIIGYVEQENGIVMLGLFLISLPLLIETSALLDVLALVILSYIIVREKPEHDRKIDELVG
ncbi:hydrogenase [Sulfuracidifex metallicus]|uniref:Hydrogenase n=1 Tax=Sulfuracidifex metallicus DSM 6482 = JCM 9184 TaxID=523847 RepID=A0A6A9QYB2_SULME|nr:hydrogenase [Sulfuracidifex metallicus]MUN30002.1 hydrogenase [Sulfuracidifex metallicus DSM 6482 = JCM 9184]WOE51617.1 hydrogenase [Sulfuracidifex metallicus DSM 6482 = JCM 9184]